MYKTTENIKSRYNTQIGSTLNCGSALAASSFVTSPEEQAKQKAASELHLTNMLEDYQTLSESLLQGLRFLRLNNETYNYEQVQGELTAYRHIQEAWKSVQLKIKDYEETVKFNEGSQKSQG